jgi:hypothetical protein
MNAKPRQSRTARPSRLRVFQNVADDLFHPHPALDLDPFGSVDENHLRARVIEHLRVDLSADV